MREKSLGRIMAVDDERETLTPLCDILSEIGYEVECFESAEDALEVFDARAFDLILVDLMMPQMDGIAFMKAAQARDPLLVCIIVTGHATVKTAVEAMKEGAFDYMTKPLNWKTLRPLLSRAMEVRRLRKSEEQYRSVVEDQTEIICRSNIDGTITFVNKAYCRYFGKTKDELIGQSYLPLIPVEDHERLKEHIASLSKENPTAVIESRVIALGGAIRWQQWTNRALFDEHGRIVELQSIGRDITNRKAAEEKLQESEEKYRLLVENANDAIIVAQDGYLKFANMRMKEYIGYIGEEIVSKPFTDFIYPDDRELVLGNHKKRLAGGKVAPVYPFRLLNKQGESFWVNISAVLITWEGRPASLSFLSNINNIKLAEEALYESERKFSAISNAARDAIVLIDNEGKAIFWNPSAEKMFGYVKEEVIGKDIHYLLAPSKYHADYKKGMQAFHQTGKGVAINAIHEFAAVNKEGVEFPIEVSTSSVLINDKWCALGIIRDITVRKETEAKIKESEEKSREQKESFRALFENATDGIIIQDQFGTIISVNKKICEVHMMTKEELKGMNIKLLETSRQDSSDRMKRILQGETVTYENAHYKRDGGIILFEVSSSAILSSNKILIQSFYRDITEKKRMQEHMFMVRKLEELGSFSAGLAHNFNNYLQAIMGYTENLIADKELEKSTRDQIIHIESTAKKATELIKKLQSFSRIDLGPFHYVNLHEVLIDTIRLGEQMIGNNIIIKTDFYQEEPCVDIDIDQIEQSVTNLIINARDAMPNGGTITLKTEIISCESLEANQKPQFLCTKVVRLFISDTGHGIPSTKIGKIFQPFFTTKEKGKGTGLGLATVYRTVEEHKGRICVESSMGEGATFIIILPISEKTQEPIGLSTRSNGKNHILIVDDDQNIVNLMGSWLNSEEYDVYIASNPLIALEKFRKHSDNVPLVITDMVMPNMDGEGLIKNVKSIKESVKILAITGHVDDSTLKNYDIDILIKKPFAKRELIAAVQKLVQEYKEDMADSKGNYLQNTVPQK